MVQRYIHNPIIRPQDVKPSRPDFEVICVFNAGVAKLGDEVILLLRVAERPINQNSDIYIAPVYDVEKAAIIKKSFNTDEPGCDFSDSRWIRTPSTNYITSISHLRVARSRDGIHFEIEETPSISPANIYEVYGIEDARITSIDNTFYISYSAISDLGITSYLASTKDFIKFQRHGVIFHPDNKDVEIFPEKINGRYYALNRPSMSHFGKMDIWISESPDLISWGNHRHLAGAREGYWDNGRIGGSAVPFRVKEGWLEIYHGATKDDKYCLGAMLLDPEQPWKVIARSEKPIMEPVEDYEINGFFGNVIFTCGVIYENDVVKVYYGAADTHMCYAEIPIEDVMGSLGLKQG